MTKSHLTKSTSVMTITQKRIVQPPTLCVKKPCDGESSVSLYEPHPLSLFCLDNCRKGNNHKYIHEWLFTTSSGCDTVLNDIMLVDLTPVIPNDYVDSACDTKSNSRLYFCSVSQRSSA